MESKESKTDTDANTCDDVAWIGIDGYHVPQRIASKYYEQIQHDLTFVPVDAFTGTQDSDDCALRLWHDEDHGVVVPKQYGIRTFGKAPYMSAPQRARINFTGELRPYQVEIVETCIEHLKLQRGGLLCVPCGQGKTSMSIYIASRIRLRTLFLTHKSSLLYQLASNCEKFTDARVGVIRQNRCDIDGCDVVVAMVHSLYSREMYKNKSIDFTQFGLLIVDEVHRFGSGTFVDVLMKLNIKYTIGLTATPHRNDGMMPAVNALLGDIMYHKALQSNNQVVVKQFHYSTWNPALFFDKQKKIRGEMRMDNVGMISNIAKLASRTNHLIDIIDVLRCDPSRQILVLSDRKSTQLAEMKEALDACDGDDCVTRYYTGSTKHADRLIAEQSGDVIFATYSMAHEGLDIERLNTIVLATPKKDVVQAVGRIMRRILENGDVRPLIIDVVDDLIAFKNQARVREKFYREVKYKVERHYLFSRWSVTEQEYNRLRREYKQRMRHARKPVHDESTDIAIEDMLATDPVCIIED